MKSFNDCLPEYRKQIQKGVIVAAYRGLMQYMKSLRIHFKNRFPDYSVPGDIYLGYMDMTYFPLITPKLKNKGLKIAIVLIHDNLRFEVWLAGSNKTIQAKYWRIVKERKWEQYRIPAAIRGQDSIIGCDLVEDPDFSDPDNLTRHIEEQTMRFVKDIEAFLDGI